MTSLTKSLEPSDYQFINGAAGHIKAMARTMEDQGFVVEVGHGHRMWEYGRAIMAMEQHFQERMSGCRVLDVGAGNSVLGPTLALRYGCDVTEIGPDVKAHEARQSLASLLNKRGKFRNLLGGVEDDLPLDTYDAVFCISVLEHIDPDYEPQAWLRLASRVKTNGVLFITVDVVPKAGKYKNDDCRKINYTMEMIRQRVELLEKAGFVSMGRPDYEYHGAYVHDYSFASVGMWHSSAFVQDEVRKVMSAHA